MWNTTNIIILLFAALLLCLIVIALLPISANAKVQYKERHTNKLCTEKVAAASWMLWLYHNPVGKLSLFTVVQRYWLSQYIGRYMDSPASAKRIMPFVRENAIDMSSSRDSDFQSFNAFFVRSLKTDARPVDTAGSRVVSPADGKVMVYPSVADTDFVVKGYRFNVCSFLQDVGLSRVFADGAMVVVRLAPTDYHRFHSPVAAKIGEVRRIRGQYFSVSPIALRSKPQLFCLNERSYHLMHHEHIGTFVMAEVGATFVGSIVQTFEGSQLAKGDEKGYFKFGGSTVVLLFPKDKLQFDADLIKNSAQGIETKVQMGEGIAEIL